jgi:hypothetical protein
MSAFIGPIQQTVSCVTKAVLIEGQFGPGPIRSATFRPQYVPLQGRHRLELSILLEFDLERLANNWLLQSRGYGFQIRQLRGPEVIAFHWHPLSERGWATFPHLHIGQPTSPIDIGSGRHIPTGRVSIAAVVRFLIKELHVRPQRSDWEAVIANNESSFDAVRAW